MGGLSSVQRLAVEYGLEKLNCSLFKIRSKRPVTFKGKTNKAEEKYDSFVKCLKTRSGTCMH